MNPLLGLLLTVLLLGFNALFVAAEFSVTSSRRAQIEPLYEAGQRGAAHALYALEHVSLMLAICQLGITVMSTSLGVITEPAIAQLLQGPLTSIGVPEASVHMLAFAIALLIVLYLHVVLGEMVPKNLSITTPQKTLLLLAPLLVAVGRVLRPLVSAMDRIANSFLKLFGIQPSSEIAATFTLEEVANIVEVSQSEGKLEDELGLLSGTIKFSQESAAEVMVSREDLFTLPQTCTPEDVEHAVAQTGFSRFPVCNETGTLTGYLHVKDVLYAEGDERTQPVTKWRIRKLGKAEPQTEVEDALRLMQTEGAHMLEVNAGGKTEGVLFLEDVLERLVGEVRDSLQRYGEKK